MLSAGPHRPRPGPAVASAPTGIRALPARVTPGRAARPIAAGLAALRPLCTTRWAVGATTLGLVSALARRLSSPTRGLVAAASLAVAFLHVRDSALATPAAPMTGLVVLSLLGAAGVLRYGRPRDYALAAVAAGLATAAKYNAILVVGACIAAHGLREIQTGGS